MDDHEKVKVMAKVKVDGHIWDIAFFILTISSGDMAYKIFDWKFKLKVMVRVTTDSCMHLRYSI